MECPKPVMIHGPALAIHKTAEKLLNQMTGKIQNYKKNMEIILQLI